MSNEKDKVSNKVIIEATMREADARDDEVSLPLNVQEEIGRRLRVVYGQLTEEPLPDRFAELLDKLSSSEKLE